MQELESLALMIADMNTQIRSLQGAVREREDLIGVLREENTALRVENATAQAATEQETTA